MGQIRIAVLASGSGSDLQSILDACTKDEIDGDVVLVISDNEDAFALERARGHGAEAVFVSRRGLKRETHERRMADVIDSNEIDLVVLAGYMRMFTPYFVERYFGMMINIHPALLPLFGGPGMYGIKPHRAVIESGMKVSGCTTHFVTNDVDMGPIIAQRCVPVEEGDTPESLQKRVLAEEHRLLPRTVQMYAQGRLSIEGKRVIISEAID